MSMKQQNSGIAADALKESASMRVFDAPVEKVWRAWSDPEFFMRWWGPRGYTSNLAKTDFRVGGKYLWNMHSPEGKDFYTAGVFKEIVPMKKIVYTDSFADETGKIVPASYYNMPGKWPDVLTATLTFEDMDGKTRLTWDEPGLPEEARKDAMQGTKETLDKLEEALK